MTAAAPAPVGKLLFVAVALVAAWAAYVLVHHPDFQPVHTLRASAPAVALVLGAAVTHLVAKQRARVDVDGEFNPTGRSLFLGVVMLAVTVLGWLVVAQALPASLTASFGDRRSEAGVVAQRMPVDVDPDCRYRLEVTSASISRAMDECVAQEVWNQAATGGAVTLDLVASRLGAEIVGVRH